MKQKILLYSSLAILLFAGCKKDDGAIRKGVVVTRFPFVTLAKTTGSPVEIVPSTIATFTGKVDVSLLYSSDAPPEKVDLVIIKNGDKTKVKIIKAGITTFPTTVNFTGTELNALFGVNTVTCDGFTIGVDVYSGGVKYEAFPITGAAYGSTGVANQPNFVSTLQYNTKVEYDANIYKGDFIVVSDEFADFTVGSTVAITQVSANQFSFIQPQVENPIPMVFTVDVATLGVSLVPKQKIGDWFLWEPTYTNPNVSVPVNAAQSFVAPCSKTLTLMMNYSVDQGNFSPYKLVLRKP